MFLAEEYMGQLVAALRDNFSDRLLYVGLQGSYMRGEATESSDIDPVVIIDHLSIDDLNIYRQIISNMESPEKSCGFICGSQELIRWNPLEICHLLHSTKDLYGKLADLVPSYSREDVRNFAKLSVNNLYHEICHRYLHASREQNAMHIADAYKNVFFILQNVYFLEKGIFATTKMELKQYLNEADRKILDTAAVLKVGTPIPFDQAFLQLYGWCKDIMNKLSAEVME